MRVKVAVPREKAAVRIQLPLGAPDACSVDEQADALDCAERKRRAAATCITEGCERRKKRKYDHCGPCGGGRRCQVNGCRNLAVGKYKTCKRHGGGRRCSFLGCDKSAQYGGVGEFRHRCIQHGGSYRCSTSGCNLAAQAGYPYCREHGGGERCSYPGCSSYVMRNHRCGVHGGFKVCEYPGCEARASCTGDKKRISFCSQHGGAYKCTGPYCPNPTVANVVKSAGARCALCKHGLKERRGLQERVVAKVLQSKGFIFKKQLRVGLGSSVDSEQRFALVDFALYFDDRIVLLEVDEHQHSAYDGTCELKRMMDVSSRLMLAGELRPIKWIRYNPDPFKAGAKRRNPSRELRAHRLVDAIRAPMPIQPAPKVMIHYMYYDTDDDGVLALCGTLPPALASEHIVHSTC